MSDILEEIVAHKRQEVEEFKKFVTPANLYNMVEQRMPEIEKYAGPATSMRRGIDGVEKPGSSVSFKRKSPQ
jgi:indole-3-glycerol phosphate synthase